MPEDPTLEPTSLQPPPFTVVHVGGVPFALTTLEEAACRTARRAIANRVTPAPTAIRLTNAYCIAVAAEDESYRDILTGSGVNLPDGAPVAWFLKRSAPEAEQVRGPSYFIETIRSGLPVGVRHFFFGATTDTLERLARELRERFPEIDIAGTLAPTFGDVAEVLSSENLHYIKSSGPDIVWVGLGTPKQDFVAEKLTTELNVPCAGVGAAFDFIAGTVREAPAVIQGSGFEWLYRLLHEPRRLWRRYLFGNVRFLVAALRFRD